MPIEIRVPQMGESVTEATILRWLKKEGDLVAREEYAAAKNIAVARLEELYPFPHRELEQLLSGYPNLREVIWLQEEPRNMGAWVFVSSRVRALLPPDVQLTYVGRPKAASPSEGSSRRHTVEQNRLLLAALSEAPKPSQNGAKSKRSTIVHAH